jgi:hypothetical protein
MSKQRLENTLKRLKKGLSDSRPNMDSHILFLCMTQNKTPKDKRLKKILMGLQDFHYLNLCGGIYPSMPCDAWLLDNNTACQSEDYKEPIKHLKPEKPSLIKMGVNVG